MPDDSTLDSVRAWVAKVLGKDREHPYASQSSGPDYSKTAGLPGPVFSVKQILTNPGQSAAAAGDWLNQQVESGIKSAQVLSQSIFPESMVKTRGAAAIAAALPGLLSPTGPSVAISSIQNPAQIPPGANRAYEFMNNLPVIGGIPQVTSEAFQEAKSTADPSSLEETKIQPVLAATGAALKALLPLQEATNLIRGGTLDKSGELIPITPKQATQDLLTGAVKAYGAKTLASSAPNNLAYDEGATFDKILKNTRSIGEMKAALGDKASQSLGLGKVELGPETPALDAAAKDHLYEQELLRQDVTRRIVTEQTFGPIVQKFLLDYDPAQKAQSSIHEAIVRSIIDPATQSKYISELGDTYGASVADMKQVMAKGVDKASEYAGGTLKVFSDAVQSLHDDLIIKQNEGSIAERARIKKMLSSLDASRQGVTGEGWQKISGILGNIESLRRAGMVSQLSTALGNFAAQGLTTAATVSDAVNTSLLKSLKQGAGMAKDLVTGEPVRDFNATTQLADATEAFGALYRHFPVGRWIGQNTNSDAPLGFHPIDAILQASPLTKHRLLGGQGFELAAQLSGDIAGGGAQLLKEAHTAMNANGGIASTAGWNAAYDSGLSNFKDLIDTLPFEKFQTANAASLLASTGKNMLAAGKLSADLLNTFNRAQETWFRRTLFDARFRANLKDIGMDYQTALDHLNNQSYETDPASGVRSVTKIPSDLRTSLADAELHALKNTFAMTPEGGLLGGVLKGMNYFSKEVFPLTSIVTPFPRFLVNNIIWQTEHSPTHVFNLFGEGGAAALGSAESGALGQITNMRRVGQGATGAMLTGANYLMATGHALNGYIMGPKPNLFWNGERDDEGNPKYLDTRFLQPFYSYATSGWMLNRLVQHQPIGLDPEDYAQAYTNNNVEDSPVFTLGETMRNLKSDNPDTIYETAMKMPGQYLGSWVQAIKGIHADLNALPSALVGDRVRDRMQPDLEHQPIAGPVLAGVQPTDLPAKFDSFQNKYTIQDQPGLALTHFNTKSQTPTQQWFTGAGVSLNSITPDLRSPAANDEIRRITGQILAIPENQSAILQEAFKTVPQALIPWLQPSFKPDQPNTIDTFAQSMMDRSKNVHNTSVAGQTVQQADFMSDLNQYAISKIKEVIHEQAIAQFEALEEQRVTAGKPPLISVEAKKNALKAIGYPAQGFNSLEGPLMHFLHDTPAAALKIPVEEAPAPQQ